jgi:hypothetical protein
VAAIYLLDVPEFQPIAISAQRQGLTVTTLRTGYIRLESPGILELRRKPTGVKLPVWFGAPTGGLEGRIELFDKELLRIVDA